MSLRNARCNDKDPLRLIQWCINPRRQVFQVTKFCTVTPNICGSPQLVRVTSLAPNTETASTYLDNLFNPVLMTCTFCYNFVPRGSEVFSILTFQASWHYFLNTRLPNTGVCYSRPIGATVLKPTPWIHKRGNVRINVIMRRVRVTNVAVGKQ